MKQLIDLLKIDFKFYMLIYLQYYFQVNIKELFPSDPYSDITAVPVAVTINALP